MEAQPGQRDVRRRLGMAAMCAALALGLIVSGAWAVLRDAVAPVVALEALILVVAAALLGHTLAAKTRTAADDAPRRRPFERRDRPLPDGPLFVVAIALAGGDRPPHARLLRDDLERAFPGWCFDHLAPGRIGAAFSAPDQVAAIALLESLRIAIERLGGASGGPHGIVMGLAGPGLRDRLRDVTHAALAALDTAQRTGLAVAIDDPAEARRAIEDQALMRDLAEAIADDALTLAYQPKLCARTGAIDSLEALVRWEHPERGTVTPGYFVPIAERSGTIRALTEWVIGRAIVDSAHFAAAGVARRIYVNVSAGLVGDPGFAAWLIDRLTPQSGMIGIEITETAVLSDPQRALSLLDRLAAAGIGIAIDDYGAGLSSLSYLKRLPATELKIDMMFIRDLAVSNRDPMIVRSTIDLAHGLGMRVTAEGVDKPATLALLRVMGCDLLQGYHIARPMPADALIAFLLSHDPEKTDMHEGIGLQMMRSAA